MEREGRVLIIIAGPCVIESEELFKNSVEFLFTLDLQIPYKKTQLFYKTSFVKDNRTDKNNYNGLGFERGIEILKDCKNGYLSNYTNFKFVTDFHSVEQIEKYSQYVDVIQIPAFLGMQTSLLEAAIKNLSSTQFINIKKPQFVTGETLAKKIESFDVNKNQVWITERGNCYGNDDLVLDVRNIHQVKMHGFTSIIDGTHIKRRYGSKYESDEKDSEKYILTGIINRCDGIFLETHPNPSKALCDSSVQSPYKESEHIIEKALKLYDFIQR